MGCCLSNPLGHDDVYAEELFKKLNIQKADLRKLREVFDRIDVNKLQKISVDELLAYFQVESTPLVTKLFQYAELDGSGTLTFVEFASSMWNILSIDKKNIAALAFSMFDYNNAGNLSFEKIRTLVETLHNQQYIHNAQIRGMVDGLHGKSKHLTVKEFVSYHSKHPSIVEPLLQVQAQLRVKLLGSEYWIRLENDRLKRVDLLDPLFARSAYSQYCKKWFHRAADDRSIHINHVTSRAVPEEPQEVTIPQRVKPTRNSYPFTTKDEQLNVKRHDDGSEGPSAAVSNQIAENVPRISRIASSGGSLQRMGSVGSSGLGVGGGGESSGASPSAAIAKMKKGVRKLQVFSSHNGAEAPECVNSGNRHRSGSNGTEGSDPPPAEPPSTSPHQTASRRLKDGVRKVQAFSQVGEWYMDWVS